MRPFGQLIANRAKDPERCVREVMTRLNRWKDMSGGKQVTLDEVAWFAAVMLVAGVKADEDVKNGVAHGISHVDENGVHSIVADDSTRNVVDSVG